jgi:hypothetical protein
MIADFSHSAGKCAGNDEMPTYFFWSRKMPDQGTNDDLRIFWVISLAPDLTGTFVELGKLRGNNRILAEKSENSSCGKK